MRTAFSTAVHGRAPRGAIGVLLGAALLSGCGYFPVPPDPIRLVDSPAEVSTCRRLGSVGTARTDGEGPFRFDELTVAVPAVGRLAGPRAPIDPTPDGPNLAVRLNVMRDAALALRASDLLLVRRRGRDWAYVEGVAYRCRY